MSKSLVVLLIVLLCASSLAVAVRPSYGTVTANSWVTKAPMPTARGGLGVVAVGDCIFAIGGLTSSAAYPSTAESNSFVGTNEEYNITTGVWTQKAPMPTPRGYFAIAAYQNKIYCIGGQVGWSQNPAMDNLFEPTMSSVNEAYDIATNTWETKASMPSVGMNLQATVVNGGILVNGGRNGVLYNPTTDSWTNSTILPLSFWNDNGNNGIYYLAVNFENKTLFTDVQNGAVAETSGLNAPVNLYVISPNANQVYNPPTGNWTKAATMPTPRTDFGLAVANDTIYSIGGFISGSSSNTNEQYTPIGYGTITPSPSSTASIPELSWLIIVPLLLSMFFVAVLTKCRRQMRKSNIGKT